jgi:hypothetical protein
MKKKIQENNNFNKKFKPQNPKLMKMFKNKKNFKLNVNHQEIFKTNFKNLIIMFKRNIFKIIINLIKIKLILNNNKKE